MPETIKEFFERLEREGKEICDFHRVVGKDPYTGEDVDMIVIKTCKIRKEIR
jgi:hypothetical protein